MQKRTVSYQYRNYLYRRVLFLVGLIVLLPPVMFYALCTGPVKIAWFDIFRILFDPVGSSLMIPENTIRIVYYSRLPQALSAILAGAGLAVSGATMQASLRNPLCSPFTLGISSAAAFGAALAVFLYGGTVFVAGKPAQAATWPIGIVTLGAFLSAILATLLVLTLSARKAMKPETIILVGVALGSFYGAGIMLLQYFADEQQLAAMVYWTFGDTQRATWPTIGWIAILLGISLCYFFSQAWNYNALALGEENATALGIHVRKLRLGTMLFASLLTATLVASLGIIGFVGLVVPHLVRILIGSDNRFILPCSCLGGALLLLLSDTLARSLLEGRLIPVSILTAFLGAPVFLIMLMKRTEY